MNNNQYSVPYYLVGKQVECKYTKDLVEIFYLHQRIASHVINNNKGNIITLIEHMPKKHQNYKKWDIEVFMTWAKVQSAGIYNLAHIITANKSHPAQVYRFHLGLKQLLRQYDIKRVHNACCRAIALNTISYQSLSSILKTGLDNQPYLGSVQKLNKNINHEHLRGADYYNYIKS